MVPGVIGIGSGGQIAQAAAVALTQNTEMPTRAVVEAAMNIAASICVYTNDTIIIFVVINDLHICHNYLTI